MTMQKFTQAEQAEVLTPEEHKNVEEGLHSLGKTSARDLSDEERKSIFEDSLDDEA